MIYAAVHNIYIYNYCKRPSIIVADLQQDTARRDIKAREVSIYLIFVRLEYSDRHRIRSPWTMRGGGRSIRRKLHMLLIIYDIIDVMSEI